MTYGSSLRLLRRQWERNAKLDLFWTILSREDRRQGRWGRDEFFATGMGDVKGHLERLKAAGFLVGKGRALDFGCGVGRLTRPLAEAFGSAVGVDISRRMVDTARNIHSGVAGLSFAHNERPDLQIFETASFDFVYSLITLQHIPLPLAVSYMGEMVRVCRPNGLILVQIVTARLRTANLFWPPTLVTLIFRELNRRLAFRPVIAMYTMTEATAATAIANAGGEIVASWPASVGSDFESRLIAIRPTRPCKK